ASNVNNYELVNTFDAIAVNATGVTKIWMLLNADLAQNGQNFATVFLSGTNSTTQSFSLITGTDVRDYYQGNASTTINGTTTRNFYSVNNVQGHQAVGFGLVTGNFRLDEIELTLSNAFLTETLNTLTIFTNNTGTWGVPIVAAITVE